MYRPQTTQLKSSLLFILFSISVLAASCHKSDQPASSTGSTSSASPGASGPATSPGNFEGIVAMKMTTGSQKEAEMTYYLKGQHSRIETSLAGSPERQGVMIWDLQDQKMTTLMPTMKKYMTMDLKETSNRIKDAAKEVKKEKGEEDPDFPKLTATGKQETIAGYPCEHYLMGEKQNIDMCVAKGLGYFGMGGQMGAGAMLKTLVFNPKLIAAAAAHPEWLKLLQGGAFPLKFTTTADGNVGMMMEATKIEKKALDDSLFTVPPDYTEIKIPGQMTGKH